MIGRHEITVICFALEKWHDEWPPLPMHGFVGYGSACGLEPAPGYYCGRSRESHCACRGVVYSDDCSINRGGNDTDRCSCACHEKPEEE